MSAPVVAGKTGVNPVRATCGAVLLLYFARFVGPGLSAGFNPDDPMNIYMAWHPGWGRLVADLFDLYGGRGRAMGSLYFCSLYELFGLNPLPYHIVITALLLLNVWLLYCFVRILSGSELAAGLAALLVAFHGRMAQLIYLPAFVFDVLAFTFYFGALTYYVRIRARGLKLSRWQMVGFIALYFGALDSKEMAATLPLAVLLYELVWHGRRLAWAPIFWTGLTTAVYAAGKVVGPNSPMTMPAYRPELSWARYWETTIRFLKEVFYQSDFLPPLAIVLAAAALVGLALLLKNKLLLFAALFVWIAPLPLNFLERRGGGCLYIPLAGWAIVAATLFLAACGLAAKAPGIGPRFAVAAFVPFGVALLWVNMEVESSDAEYAFRDQGRLTWSTIRQVQAVQPRVKPGSKVYVDNSPFTDWDLKFIMELVFHDRTVDVWLGDKAPLPPHERSRMDYEFTFEGGRLKKVRGS